MWLRDSDLPLALQVVDEAVGSGHPRSNSSWMSSGIFPSKKRTVTQGVSSGDHFRRDVIIPAALSW